VAEDRDGETHWVIGYGSLLHRGSLGKTIGPATDAATHPVWVEGLKRFYALPPRNWWSRVPSQRLRFGITERAAAAVVEQPGYQLNALAIPVDESQLQALDHREGVAYGRYQRTRVSCTPFSPADCSEVPDEAWCYVTNPDHLILDTNRLLPHWPQYALARRGAYAVSSTFGEAFDETTYLGDGSTSAFDSYAAVWPAQTQIESMSNLENAPVRDNVETIVALTAYGGICWGAIASFF